MHQQENEYLVLQSIYESLDHPRSLTMWLLLKHSEFSQFFAVEFDPLCYNDVDSARLSLQATKLASKFIFRKCRNDTRSAALETYFEFEEKCRQTNERFKHGATFSSLHSALLFGVQRTIARILGSFSIDFVLDESNWGPGVSILLKGKDATVANKFHNETSITPLCYQVFWPVFKLAYPLWASNFIDSESGESRIQFQKFNSIVTVPKNSKTDRTISIEPGLNLWFQKGIGSLIRSKLRSVGIDLQDQSHNRRLSRVASKFNHLATIDFSSASDSISTNLLNQLLPSDWFSVLVACRSNTGRLDGNLIEYEKFSSMGNGFTFELESLLFYAIASSFYGEDADISIYGDDLIVPVGRDKEFQSFCDFLGFRINSSKSYSSSYYRESCGGHFWNGVEITPFLIREDFTSDLSVLKLANRLREYSHRWISYGCDIRLKPPYDLLVSLLKRVNRIPFGYGDAGLVSNFDEACPPVARNCIEGYRCKMMNFNPALRCRYDLGLLLSKLKNGVKRDSQNYESLPRLGRYRLITVIVPWWYDLGPWA